MNASDQQTLRGLLDEYLTMYAGRDDALTGRFSDDFTGFTGGGDFLVKDRDRWVAITRQDFAQVKDPIRIELKDVAIQSLADTVALATAFFAIHLPIKDEILSRETARLVLIFRREATGWMITHSSISVPYYLVREGEVYPLHELGERNRQLEERLSSQATQLSEAVQELSLEAAERRKAEQRSRESEAIYRSILNASADDITVTDLQGRITLLSPKAVSMFGFDRPEEGLGRHVTEFLVPEDRERATAKLVFILRGAPADPAEYRAVRKDGTTLDIEVHTDIVPGLDGRPSGFVVIVRDVTARKLAEATLRDSEEKYRTLVERANEGIIIVQQGVLVFANRKMSDMVGVPVDELTGRSFIDFVWPADREQAFSNYTRRLSGESIPSEYELRIVGAGGAEKWVYASAALIRWQGRPATLDLVTDITERKHAQDALQRAFAQIKTLRGLLPICMYCKKIRDSRGEWSPVEVYVRDRTDAEFSHGLCPECAGKWYPPEDDGASG